MRSSVNSSESSSSCKLYKICGTKYKTFGFRRVEALPISSSFLSPLTVLSLFRLIE